MRSKIQLQGNRRLILAGATIALLVLGVGAFLTPIWTFETFAEGRYPSWFPVPSEDAHILFRYSQHLSDGHGIVWNLGDSPVDGSTDFMWMLIIAAWAAVFGSVIPGFYFMGILFAIGAAAIGYPLLRRLGLPTWPAGIFAGATLVSPMAYHVVHGFGVPLYAMVLGTNLALLIAATTSTRPLSTRLLTLWSLVMLAVGLARPEANIFNAFVIISYVGQAAMRRDYPATLRFLRTIGLGYLLPGMAILLFRLVYFGDVLPSSFYVKVGTEPLLSQMHHTLLVYWRHVFIPQALLFFLIIPSVRHRWGRGLLLAYLVVLAYFAVYLGFSQTQNIAMRFQYHTFYLSSLIACVALAFHAQQWHHDRAIKACLVVMGIVGVGWATFVVVASQVLRQFEYRWQAALLGCLVACFVLAFLAIQWRRHDTTFVTIAWLGAIGLAWAAFLVATPHNHEPSVDDRRQVAHIMSTYRDRGYSVASVDAGVIPFVSRWRTLDSAGLNDPHIGRNGLDQMYWDSYNPALVMQPTYTLDPLGERERQNRKVSYEIMRSRGDYVPVAIVDIAKRYNSRFGRYNAYFLRRDLPEFEEIAAMLSSLDDQSYVEIPQAFSDYFSER